MSVFEARTMRRDDTVVVSLAGECDLRSRDEMTVALHHYLRSELGNERDLLYEVYASAITKWSFEEFEGKPIFVADKLERVMRANPHLRVRIEYGYYDLATPYHAAEDMVAHLRLPDEAFDRIEHEYFETGHMPYLHEPSRKRESASIAAFVERG